MRTTAAAVLGAGLFCATGTSASRADEGQKQAWATVEVVAESERRGPSALLDQAWLQDLFARANWAEFLNEAGVALVEKKAPEFAGLQAWEIVWKAGCTVTVERHGGDGIEAVKVSGADQQRCAAYANAVQDWIVATAKKEAKRRHDVRKASLDDRIATCDSYLHLLTLDKTTAYRGLNFSESTFAGDFDRMLEAYRARRQEADDLGLGVVRDAETYKEFKAALDGGAKGVDALAGHVVLLRDEHLRDLDEQVAATTAERDVLLRAGKAKDADDVIGAERELAKAAAARASAATRLVTLFVRDFEDRQARQKRVIAALDDDLRSIDAAWMLRRHAEQLDADIQRRIDQKKEAQAALEELTRGDGEANDAVQILTRAWAPAPAAAK